MAEEFDPAEHAEVKGKSEDDSSEADTKKVVVAEASSKKAASGPRVDASGRELHPWETTPR